MRDALAIELSRTVDAPNGEKVKKLRMVARKLIETALEGDVVAIKEINDRMDGKATQSIDLTAEVNSYVARLPEAQKEPIDWKDKYEPKPQIQ